MMTTNGKIGDNEILEELLLVLSTPVFQNSPLLTRFLGFVVHETLSGRENQIKEYTIATNVLGRTSEFSLGNDASVRVHAMRLRKALGDYYESPPKGSKVMIELPKGSYRPQFHRSENLYINRRGDAQNSELSEVICVVPFSGLVNDTAPSFSTAGFCQYLSEQLTRFQDISVVSSQSAMDYLANGGQLANLNRDLGVGCYLTGSIEFTELRIVVSVQLYDARDSQLIWSHDCSREIHEHSYVDIVEDISKTIISSIAGYSGYAHQRLFQRKDVPRLTGNAANAIFWFYHYQARHSEELFHECVKQIESSLKVDDSFALSWAVLANLYCDGLIYNYDIGRNPLKLAEKCVRKAISLDPECQHAYLSGGWLNIIRQEWDDAIMYLDKMLELNPNSSFFISTYSLGMSFIGKYDLGLRYWEEALKLNPLPYWWLSLPKVFLALKHRRYEEALFHSHKQGTPKMVFENIFEMIALYRLGRIPEVRELLEKYQQKYPTGLHHVQEKLPMILRDRELRAIVSESLEGITRLAGTRKTTRVSY